MERAKHEDTGPQSVDRLWSAEIERRSARLRSGETSGIPWPEVKRQIEQKLIAKR